MKCALYNPTKNGRLIYDVHIAIAYICTGIHCKTTQQKINIITYVRLIQIHPKIFWISVISALFPFEDE